MIPALKQCFVIIIYDDEHGERQQSKIDIDYFWKFVVERQQTL